MTLHFTNPIELVIPAALFTYTKEFPDSQVEAAVTYVEELSKSKRLYTKKIFKCQELTLSARTLLPIICHEWLMDDVSSNSFIPLNVFLLMDNYLYWSANKLKFYYHFIGHQCLLATCVSSCW